MSSSERPSHLKLLALKAAKHMMAAKKSNLSDQSPKIVQLPQKTVHAFNGSLRQYPSPPPKSAGSRPQTESSREDRSFIHPSGAQSARLRDKKWSSKVFLKLDDDADTKSRIDRMNGAATPDWALVSEFQRILYQEEQKAEADRKKQKQIDTQKALSTQLQEQLRAHERLVATKVAEFHASRAQQAANESELERQAQLRRSQQANYFHTLAEQEAQAAARARQLSAEQRAHDERTQQAVQRALQREKMEAQQQVAEDRRQFEQTMKENAQIRLRKIEEAKQAAAADREMIRQQMVAMDAAEERRRQQMADLARRVQQKAAVGFEVAASLEEKERRDAERARQAHLERLAREEEQERAKRRTHEQLKRETQQTLARQMAEREAARQEQIRQLQEEARSQAELMARHQAEERAEKQQRRVQNESIRQVLDQQIAAHRHLAAKPPGRMSDHERSANAALLRQVEEKLQMQFSNHSQLVAAASTVGHKLPPKPGQRRSAG